MTAAVDTVGFGWSASILTPRTARTTMQRMAAVVDSQLLDPRILDTAARIVAGLPGQNFDAQARTLARWMRAHTRFLRDPEGRELLRSPLAMLATIDDDGRASGDCDDVAMLAAALGRAVGFPARFVAEAYYPDGPFQHVYTALRTPGAGWLAIDVARGDVPPLHAVKQLTYDLTVS